MIMVQEQFISSKEMRRFFILLLSVCSITAYAQFSQVKTGDIISINGVKAIVYQVDQTGSHGTAMTIQCLRGVSNSWCDDSKLVKNMPSMDNENDGIVNTKAVIDYAKSIKSLDKFPAFNWCNNLGDGWYIPAVKELEAFVNFWLGNEQTIDWENSDNAENAIDDSKPFYKQVNAKIIDAGGVPFLNGVFTSSVDKNGKVLVFFFDRQKNVWSFQKWNKSNLSKYFVGRAFHKF